MSDEKNQEIEKGWDEFKLNPWLSVFVIFFIIEMAVPIYFFAR